MNKSFVKNIDLHPHKSLMIVLNIVLYNIIFLYYLTTLHLLS